MQLSCEGSKENSEIEYSFISLFLLKTYSGLCSVAGVIVTGPFCSILASSVGFERYREQQKAEEREDDTLE